MMIFRTSWIAGSCLSMIWKILPGNCAQKNEKSPRISPEALSYCPVPVQALSLRLLSVDLDGGRLLLRHLLQRDIELAVRVGCIDV